MAEIQIDGRIQQANGRLKAAKVGVKIERAGDRLCLRATFPPRPGASAQKPYQQRFYLGIHANPKGLAEAEAMAREVGAQLDRGAFQWPERSLPQQPTPTGSTAQEWVERFESHYFSTRARNPKSMTTWGNYAHVYKHLGPGELTPENILNTVKTTPADTRSRQSYCTALAMLAKFAGVDVDLSPFKGGYTIQNLSPRAIPTDTEIAAAREKIANPSWRFAFGLMACYGLRNHELFLIDLDSLASAPGILTITDGKTGGRRVWPCYPEWWERWDLGNPENSLPKITGKSNRDRGSRVTRFFGRERIQFSPYDLRHAWAIRTLGFGLDISLAAAQMGHSVAVHSRIYHHWISEQHHQRAFDLLMARTDRPTAPNL